MKIVEIVKLSAELLKRLHGFGIKMNDYEYLPLYDDYKKMRSDGHKTTYIVAVLCERYKLCERKVYKLIKHYHKDCYFDAV